MAVPYTFGTATSSIPLSQLDSNFNTVITLGNTAIQLGNTVTTLNNMTLANVTISSGNVTITNVFITTANVTTANIGTAFVSGNVSFTGTSNRITGDFTNATVASRVMFQTSTVNGTTVVTSIPNGTGTQANFNVHNNSDPTNASDFRFLINATEARLQAGITGTGTYLPMTFYTGGSESVRIGSGAASATDKGTVGIGYTALTGVGNNGLAVLGNVGIGVSSPSQKLDVSGSAQLTFAGGNNYLFFQSTNNYVGRNGTSGDIWLNTAAGQGISLGVNSTERMRITSAGDVGIGTSSPSNTLQVANGITSQIRVSEQTLAFYYDFGRDSADGFFSINGNQGLGYKWKSAGTERMRIDSSGNVLVTSAAGLGYGTGSGGTVTQATSKSTAVTLNKPTGQITMNNAALGATTSVFFDVNNSLVAGTDNVLLTISNFSSLQYSIKCHVSTGKFTVVLTNETAGSLSDAVVFNFGILKGATT